MPSKKKKYNARFPAGRIKKIMQTDEEVGKVAQAVPVIISRTLELFVESLLRRAVQITSARNAKTLTPSHMKQCILSENRFDFLKDLVKSIPDVSSTEDEPGTPVSPAVMLSSRGHTSFSGFQFKPETRVSASSLQRQPKGSTSPASPGVLCDPCPATAAPQPKFYKEIPIGNSEESSNDSGKASTPAACRAPVIQHTANCEVPAKAATVSKQHPQPSGSTSRTASNSSSEEEDEEEEEEPQNGFHAPAAAPVFRATQVVELDEDYDT